MDKTAQNELANLAIGYHHEGKFHLMLGTAGISAFLMFGHVIAKTALAEDKKN